MSVKLRPYQSECQRNVFRDINEGHTKLACVLPTGSGKTTIFGSICSQYCSQNPGKKAVVVSHLGLLVSQTGDRFEKEWGLKSGVLQAQRYPSQDDSVVITTMQSMREINKIYKWAKSHGYMSPSPDRLNVGLIIIDECHYAGAVSYKKIMEYFPNAIVLGFTATPFRENKLMTNIFEKVSYTTSMQDMIDGGYLVPANLNMVPFDTSDQADMFSKMIAIYKEKHRGSKAVVYLKTIEEAKLCRNIFVESGITCSAVTSELTGKARDELLEDYRAGKGPDVLTTVDVLTAGFDSPNLSALFIPYKVGSITVYLQRVGRGLRPYPGKQHCDIYAGSISPGIKPGFWEKMTKKMLIGGRPSDQYDDLRDILEYADISKEEYKWTEEVVKMAEDVKSKGMSNLFEMIISKGLPKYLLDVFVERPPVKKGWTKPVPCTEKQYWYLQKNGIDAAGVTKQEASALIEAHKRANGWEPPKDEIVPSGKHIGKHFAEVPPMYWQILKEKAPGTSTYQAYLKYLSKGA